ncbi:helix-turn-helix domain-containing protein [Micromonospora sp. WMMA1923]|uniref:helix-turn-helix domain-containing protein n=1 Tax=Micromonospora sp. WMMA1923 TaxID=3404125 RepID=UPI003B94457D
MEPLLLTPEQAAKQLGIGRATMYTLISSREVESVKIGRSRRIPQTAIAQYIEKLRREQSKAAA